jgi:hypothetical protein
MVFCKRRGKLIPHMMALCLRPSNSRLILERIDLSALFLGSARGPGLYGSWARARITRKATWMSGSELIAFFLNSE